VVPSFSWGAYATCAPEHLRPKRNGADEAYLNTITPTDRIYTPDAFEIGKNMGVISTAVVASPDRVRGDHPLCSFAALGPLANDLMTVQTPHNLFAPLEELMQRGGSILLLGVDLTSMTFLHFTEQKAGRVPFQRWANNRQGEPMMVAAGSCSDGFKRFEPALENMRQSHQAGRSL